MEAIIFIGIQASGKSTFYLEKFSKTHLRINLDMLKTRNREKIILDACLNAKQPIVIDNTNPTKKIRTKYIEKFKEDNFKVIGYYFKSSINECIIRNNLRSGKEKIPEVGIRGTFNKLELPEFSEDFDELYYVSIENDDFIVKEWKNEI
jgi:predicted kinase